MDVGVCLPYMERDLDRERILAWCRAIDGGPFASLSIGERVTDYTIEMRTTLGAAAAVTERVRIVPSLYVLPMHSAVQAAKEIATLDLLSGGRVTVTVGVGGRPTDYHALGASMKGRHTKMERQVGVMRRIWAGEPPEGGEEEVGPRPVQPGGPPIWAGVLGPLATQRAARWADGVYMWSGNGGQERRSSGREQSASTRRGSRREARRRPPKSGRWLLVSHSRPDSQQRLSSGMCSTIIKVLSPKMSHARCRTMVDRSTPDRVRGVARRHGRTRLRRGASWCRPPADLAEIERAAEDGREAAELAILRPPQQRSTKRFSRREEFKHGPCAERRRVRGRDAHRDRRRPRGSATASRDGRSRSTARRSTLVDLDRGKLEEVQARRSADVATVDAAASRRPT